MIDGVLPPDFFLKPAPELAVALLGCPLVHRLPDGTWVGGIIDETEAYTQDDEASHSFRGETPRNAAMFAAGGTIYVYLIYGIHHCVNISSGPAGQGEAVLLRGIRPLWGIDRMRQLRKWPEPKPLSKLCDGPGKLTKALGIDLKQDRLWPDHTSALRIGPSLIHETRYTSGPRIGITKNVAQPWRFCLDAQLRVCPETRTSSEAHPEYS